MSVPGIIVEGVSVEGVSVKGVSVKGISQRVGRSEAYKRYRVNIGSTN